MSLSRRSTTTFLVLLLLAAALGLPEEARAARYASIVIDAKNGDILHASRADKYRYPASLTKMMTLYMLFEALDQGRFTPDTPLRVSRNAARASPSKLGLRKGQTIKVKHAILSLVTKSANDVAVVVAEAIAGTERKFARKMTLKARKIGMRRTVFRNASGLPNRKQISTARDLATLGRRLLLDFPRYYHHFSTRNFRYGKRVFRNHNRMLGHYRGLDGIKTGYIRASGYNLVSSAKRGDVRLIGVVMGGRSSYSRNHHMAKLLDRSFTLASRKSSVLPLPRPRPARKAKLNRQAVVKAAAVSQLPVPRPLVGTRRVGVNNIPPVPAPLPTPKRLLSLGISTLRR